MKGLGQWDSYIVPRTAKRSSQLKTQKMILRRLSRGKSLLSTEDASSGPGESAAVHFVQSDLSDFGDKIKECDKNPAVVRTVETLSVAGSDESATRQEKEVRSVGGSLSQ